MTSTRLRRLAAVVVVAGCCACGSKREAAKAGTAGDQAAAAADRRTVATVALPDLSGAAGSVATQLREQFAQLQRRIDDSATSTADLAAAYGQAGVLLMAAEYRDAAETCLLDANALAPLEARWPYLLGHLYRLQGDTAKSASFFERAAARRPGDEAALVWLGRAHLDLGQLEDAEAAFSKAQSARPESAAAAFWLGRTALARNDSARAAQGFERALSFDPKASHVRYFLAMAYRGLGRMDEAAAQLRQKGDDEVRLADPWLDELAGSLRSGLAVEHLGIDALNRRDFAAAVSYFRQGVALSPDDTSLRHRLGTALAVSGDGPGAAAEFQEILRRAPRDASTHYALGILLAGSGRSVDALAHFAAAVQINPSYAEAHLQRAEILRRTGRAQDALASYERATALDPRLADAALGQAMALAALNRSEDARDQLSTDLSRYPERPALAHALIRLLAAAPDDRVRDGRRALAMAEELVAQEQPNPDLAEATAMAMAELGRFDDAVIWQRQAITIAGQLRRPDLASRMAANLRLFERRQPCRTPWRADEPAGSASIVMK